MKRILRVYKKTVSIVNETAVSMYENLVGREKGFLLESYDKNYDRFTILGAKPEEMVTSKGEALVITGRNGETEIRNGNPMELLKEYYSEFEIRKEADGTGFYGGLVGNLGYDFIRYTEELLDDHEDEIGIDSIQMMLMKEFIVVDHIAETLTAVVLEEDSKVGQRRAGEKGQKMIDKARRPGGRKRVKDEFRPDGRIVKKSDSKEVYKEKVRKIQEYIRQGHIFQTVLSQRWTIETGKDGFELYQSLRNLNPSPYLY